MLFAIASKKESSIYSNSAPTSSSFRQNGHGKNCERQCLFFWKSWAPTVPALVQASLVLFSQQLVALATYTKII